MIANRNFFATLLAMTIPLVFSMGLLAWFKRTDGKTATWAPWAGAMALVMAGLLAGLIQTHSRAALILGPLALVASLALLRKIGMGRQAKWSIVTGALATVIIAIQIAGSATIARFDSGVTTDLRWKIHATSLEAAHHFGALGSGLGTFVEAYQQVPPVEGFLPAYVNAAHGDYHQLWLETGVPGMALLFCFLAWFGWSSWRVWSRSSKDVSNTLVARAAVLSVLIVLMHSFLDYPLRHTALLVVFGMACALLAPSQAETTMRVTEGIRKKRKVAVPLQAVAGGI